VSGPHLGFIGLGQIGAPMAKRWCDQPGGLSVFDVVDAATAPFAAAGAHVAISPAGVAERATVISLMVRDDAQVRSVVSGSDGILATASAGTVVIIHSTVEADTPAEIAALCAPHGVAVLDAPVSGGAMGAHEGTLALMVGGDAEAVALAAPALERLGTLVAHLGPIGAGTRAKLARNLITFASYAAVGEASRLAEAAGVDLAKLGEVVRHSDRVTGGPGGDHAARNRNAAARWRRFAPDLRTHPGPWREGPGPGDRARRRAGRRHPGGRAGPQPTGRRPRRAPRQHH
jgi:3-hydroxyisobutyrate dehydrogenase